MRGARRRTLLVGVKEAALADLAAGVAAVVVRFHLAGHVVRVKVPGAHVLVHRAERRKRLEQIAPNIQRLRRKSRGLSSA
jgi:hypothetical protein